MVAKKIIISAVLILLIYENTLSAIAATKSSNLVEYSCYLKAGQDISFILQPSSSDNYVMNRVASIEPNVTLCCWCNNYSGIQIAEKVCYSTPGTYYIPIKKMADVENPSSHLSITVNISTQWFEFSPVNTSGTFSLGSF